MCAGFIHGTTHFQILGHLVRFGFQNSPNSWLKNLSMEKLRKYLLDNTALLGLAPNIAGAFTANVDTSIALFVKNTQPHTSQIFKLENGVMRLMHTVDCNEFRQNPGFIFDVESSPETRALLRKMRSKGVPVGDIFEVTRGYNPYDAATGQSQSIIKGRVYHSDHKKDGTFVPELKGKHVQPWSYCWDKKHYISYGDWLAAPRNPKFYTGSRLLFREILGQRLVCTYIEEDFKTDRSLYIAKPSDDSSIDAKCALGMLVSTLMSFYFRYANNEFDALFPKMRVAEFKQLPLIQIEDPVLENTFKKRVDQILALKKENPEADVSALESEIDQLVYKLYALTEEEIVIVEGTRK